MEKCGTKDEIICFFLSNLVLIMKIDIVPYIVVYPEVDPEEDENEKLSTKHPDSGKSETAGHYVCILRCCCRIKIGPTHGRLQTLSD